MTWIISLKGHDDHDNDLARNAYDFAIRDKAQALFNDIAKLTGGQVTEAYVYTGTTSKVEFVKTEAEAEAKDENA